MSCANLTGEQIYKETSEGVSCSLSVAKNILCESNLF